MVQIWQAGDAGDVLGVVLFAYTALIDPSLGVWAPRGEMSKRASRVRWMWALALDGTLDWLELAVEGQVLVVRDL